MQVKKRKDNMPARGSIRADEVLPLTVFCARLGIGLKGWRTLRDAGLRSAVIGRQHYILGRDAVAFFQGLAAEPSGTERIMEADGGNCL